MEDLNEIKSEDNNLISSSSILNHPPASIQSLTHSVQNSVHGVRGMSPPNSVHGVRGMSPPHIVQPNNVHETSPSDTLPHDSSNNLNTISVNDQLCAKENANMIESNEEFEKDIDIIDQEEWICELCTLKNEKDALICASCGNEKPYNIKTQWKCEMCTNLNNLNHPICDACGHHNFKVYWDTPQPRIPFRDEKENDGDYKEEEDRTRKILLNKPINIRDAINEAGDDSNRVLALFIDENDINRQLHELDKEEREKQNIVQDSIPSQSIVGTPSPLRLESRSITVDNTKEGDDIEQYKMGKSISGYIETINNINAAGIKNFNIDLMYEISNESLDEWNNDLKLSTSGVRPPNTLAGSICDYTLINNKC